jgi:hypothetical protein
MLNTLLGEEPRFVVRQELLHMGRHTGNDDVVTTLQNALQAFLADHRAHAEEDPEWIKETASATPKTSVEVSHFSGVANDPLRPSKRS